MKTKTGHKLKAPRTFKSNTRKVCCTLLASCILFSSCGKNADSPDQDLTQGMTTTAPQKTLFPSLTPTNTPKPTPTPEPTPTNTPIPTSTPEPTPALDFTFLPQPDEPDKTSLLDYMSQEELDAAGSSWIFLHGHEDTNDISDFVSTEELDAAMSLAYDSHNCPQLFARYHGRMNTYVYVIDLIQLNSQQKNSIIRLQFYSSPYRMEHPKLVQELCILIPHTDFESIENGFEILDLNEDYHDDFRLELGSDVKNVMSFYFVYDPQKEEYTYLGEFAYTTFFPEEQILYENSYATHDNLFRKYKIIGTEAILMEQVHIVEYTYSYKKRTGDELTTIIETTSYEDFLKYIDISEWSNIDWPSPEY